MRQPPEPTARATALLDTTSRDQLAVKHLDLVPKVVGRLPLSIPRGLDREDLHSAGMLGLLNAARTYEPMRGASFRTFAYTAIRAAVLDELRRHDPLPRGARPRLRELARLDVEFRSTHGRPPTPYEIADALSLTDAETEQLLGHAELDRLLRFGGATDEPDVIDPIDSRLLAPDATAERHEELGAIEQAIAALSERERQVVVLYYAESLYLKDIGLLLGVTESRICQILACAQRKIRSRIENRTNPHDD